MIQSPLNYTGGKYRLLPQILPLFPKDIHTFVDLFCGGCNVGINVNSQKVIYNDWNTQLIQLYQTFLQLGAGAVLERIHCIIEQYGLSQTAKYGYGYYGLKNGKGLAAYNKEKYQKLRQDVNQLRAAGAVSADYYIMLYVLIIFGFNNQIRFNSKGDYNVPVGNRDFNQKLEEKLVLFLTRLENQNKVFACTDFRNFHIDQLTSNDFVYADPPYLITCASYNERGGWDEGMERNLLEFLDQLQSKGIRFALSNVIRNKGKENRILMEWIRKNAGLYQMIKLDYSYSNSNYHIKDRTSSTEEVLIRNYTEH